MVTDSINYTLVGLRTVIDSINNTGLRTVIDSINYTLVGLRMVTDYKLDTGWSEDSRTL